MDRPGVLRRHALFRVMQRDGCRRMNREVRPEAARDVHAEDRFSRGVQLADEGGKRFPQLARCTDPEEGIDQEVCAGNRLLALIQAGEDLHIPEPLEIGPCLQRRELVRWAREQDRHPRILREVAGGDESVPPVVPRPAEDEDFPSSGVHLGLGDIRDRLARVFHQLQDRNAEVLRVPIEDPHLGRRNHRARIRASIVKPCPRH